jgi:hypothetical protein
MCLCRASTRVFIRRAHLSVVRLSQRKAKHIAMDFLSGQLQKQHVAFPSPLSFHQFHGKST